MQKQLLFRATLVWVRDVCLALILAAVFILFIYQPVKVEGTSMMPALVDQERIFINKFVYKLGISKIRHGDLVVFNYPADQSKSYIKRVIGLPGDTVEIEDYVPEAYRDYQSMPLTRVESDSYFVLGDHRSSSNDSRSWGLVPRDCIYGQAVFVYWPLEKLGPVQ
jgi:signal peptidase I